uniref:Dynein axonemal intermediate chain 7 n=1 Tax=Mola mola TaxID=94237 RepID=A0A3Q3VQ02_MOLML
CFAVCKSSQKGRKLTKAQRKRRKQEEEARRLREEGNLHLFLLIYMHSDGSNPDPEVPQDVNTFISLWRDDPEVDIKLLTEELEVLLREISHPQEVQMYQELLVNLQELIHCKHLLTSEEILKGASESIDLKTGNMQTVVKDENITLCLWANFKKNPNVKCFYFEEVGLGFELPKQLAVSDITLRILHTRYDHLSLLARMGHLRMYATGHRYLSSTTAPDFAHLFVPRSLAGEIPADMDASEQGEVKEEKEMQRQMENEEVQTIQWSEGEKRDLTTPSALLTVMEHNVRVVDLMQYTPLGGVFYCDVFHLPPQAHQVNDWEIRQLLDEGLQVFPYPVNRSHLDDKEGLTSPPVGMSVTLPDFVIFLETPQVARWDAAGKWWRMDGITDVNYDKEEAKISFKMDSFHPFVLMQETYANFPFQSWELRPLGHASALFTVNGALINVSITIQGNQCMLQSQQERGLAHLIGKWMSGPALQSAMINAGINIFVNEYTDKYVSTCGKDPLTEHAAYEQMALFASACAFSWSKWNHYGPNPVHECSWSLYQLSAKRNLRLEITEMSEVFAPDHYPGSEFHSTFIHMLQENMSADGITRTRGSNYLFVDTVQSLLCATRPLMHS